MSYYLITEKKAKESSLDKITLYRSENVCHLFPPIHPVFLFWTWEVEIVIDGFIIKIISRNTLAACFKEKEKEEMPPPHPRSTWNGGGGRLLWHTFLLLQDKRMLCLRHERLVFSSHPGYQLCCLHLSRCPCHSFLNAPLCQRELLAVTPAIMCHKSTGNCFVKHTA